MEEINNGNWIEQAIPNKRIVSVLRFLSNYLKSVIFTKLLLGDHGDRFPGIAPISQFDH